MNNTKHTPRPSDVMAYFDLSDEQWDILPDSVVDRLTEIYMKETAAPAMYEALQQLVKVEQLRTQATLDNDYVDLVLADQQLQTLAQAALAQADGEGILP